MHNLPNIGDRMLCCLILHNILVTDRVMDSPVYDFRQRYDPASVLEEVEVSISQREGNTAGTPIGIAHVPPMLQEVVTRVERFAELDNLSENVRLHQALMDLCSNQDMH